MTGFFHFYPTTKTTGEKYDMVSMPYDGLFSFLLSMKKWEDICPCMVSMPYDGLFSFLQRIIPVSDADYSKCQCPMTGFFHFYLRRYLNCGMRTGRVSMPYDGLFSFLPSMYRNSLTYSAGVNAL